MCRLCSLWFIRPLHFPVGFCWKVIGLNSGTDPEVVSVEKKRLVFVR